MTDKIRNASNQGLRYTSPRVKVVEVKHSTCSAEAWTELLPTALGLPVPIQPTASETMKMINQLKQ